MKPLKCNLKISKIIRKASAVEFISSKAIDHQCIILQTIDDATDDFLLSYINYPGPHFLKILIKFLLHIKPILPISGQCFHFISAENNRKPKVFWCFQGV